MFSVLGWHISAFSVLLLSWNGFMLWLYMAFKWQCVIFIRITGFVVSEKIMFVYIFFLLHSFFLESSIRFEISFFRRNRSNYPLIVHQIIKPSNAINFLLNKPWLGTIYRMKQEQDLRLNCTDGVRQLLYSTQKKKPSTS